MGARLPEAIVEEVVRLRLGGMSVKQICYEINIPKKNVEYILFAHASRLRRDFVAPSQAATPAALQLAKEALRKECAAARAEAPFTPPFKMKL